MSGEAARGLMAAPLPALSRLTKDYAASDTWFSSVPGKTKHGRLFSHAANSNDSLTQM